MNEEETSREFSEQPGPEARGFDIREERRAQSGCRPPPPRAASHSYRTPGMIRLGHLSANFLNLLRDIEQAKMCRAYIELTLLGERRVELLREMESVIKKMKLTGEFNPDYYIPTEEQIENCQGIEIGNRG